MTVKRGNRGLGFDRDVMHYAWRFALLQRHEIRAVRHMVLALNLSDEMGPYGQGWTYGMVHRMLKRGAELGLYDGPQTPREAAQSRLRADKLRFAANRGSYSGSGSEDRRDAGVQRPEPVMPSEDVAS